MKVNFSIHIILVSNELGDALDRNYDDDVPDDDDDYDSISINVPFNEDEIADAVVNAETAQDSREYGTTRIEASQEVAPVTVLRTLGVQEFKRMHFILWIKSGIPDDAILHYSPSMKKTKGTNSLEGA